MIQVDKLSKSYGEVQALREVTFEVAPREIIGLLGPNGAGKTTLMKILTGYLHPSAGTATIAGLSILTDREKVQEQIGYLPENAPLYPELTVQSYLQMIAHLRRVPAGLQKSRLSAAIRAVGLEDRLTQPIATLSKGYRQRVGLAQAILHQPRLLILDEPTNGLDPTQIAEVRRLIRALAQSATVIISTHILTEVEATCDRAIILMGGEIKADAKLADLAAASAAVVTMALPAADDVAAVLAGLAGVREVETAASDEESVTYRVHGIGSLCPEIYRLARERDWQLWELRREVRTLEAVFHDLAVAHGGVA
ncbi:MAG: ATP-binding cassette domain-containing protein [Desulfobacteraceae bacterium]|nr:ATP-binding cassette domain-containing protein [Desulfobacteraceae bacterium]